MSSSKDGVIRVERKGKRKFAFGEDGAPFDVDVVVTFQEWVCIDDSFRERSEDRSINMQDMPAYHAAALEFVKKLHPESTQNLTTAESLDFLARLHEQYNELAIFFRTKLREEPDSPDSSEPALQFSVEAAAS